MSSNRPHALDRVEPGSTAGSYGGLARRHWAVLLAGTLAGTLAAAGYVQSRDVAYTGSTSVLVRATVGDTSDLLGARTRGTINLDTEAQIVTSDAVVAAALTALGGPEPLEQLRERISVQVPPNTEILRVGVAADAPEAARAASEAVARAYLSVRAASSTAVLAAEREVLDDQVAALQERLATTAAGLAGSPADSQQRFVLVAEQSRLQDQLADADAALSTLQRRQDSPGEIVALPSTAASDRRALVLVSLLSGPFVGLLLGLGAALLLQRRRPRLWGLADVQRATATPVLVRLPEHPAGGRPSPAQAKAFVRLRNQVVLMTEPSPRVVMVVGAGTGTEAARVAAGLAGAYRADGVRVAVAPEPGRTALPPGSADVVVVHAADMSASAEAQTLAPGADVVLLLVTEEVTRPEELTDAVEQLEGVRAQYVGIVVAPRARRTPRGTRSAPVQPAPAPAPAEPALDPRA